MLAGRPGRGHDATVTRARRSLPVLLAAATVAVGAVLAGCGSGGSSQPSASGAELFASNCARCHGAEGQGGVGPSLAGIARTFPEVDGQIAFVSNGGGGMPRFGDLLSDADIRAVVEYTRATFR